jgi:FtsP/CotA-like multicopper oxidase with cupredoxin domain
MYYGNPSATSISNGTATFDFFDDFDPDKNTWTIVSGTWSNVNGYQGNSKKGIHNGTPGYRKSLAGPYFNLADFVLHAKVRSTVDNSLANIVFRAATNGNDDNNRIWVRLDQRDVNTGSHLGGFHLFEDVVGTEYVRGYYDFNPVVGQWYDIKVTVNGSTIKGYLDGSLKWTATVSRTSAGYILLQVEYLNTHDAWFDNLFICKFASNEPTISIGSEEVVTFIITASAGPNGSISPSGAVSVNYGEDKIFTIIPNTGYHIVDVKVDGVSVGAITSYTFTHVTSNHTIDATFAIDTFTITASAGPNGSISPSGAVSVNYGEDKIFTIIPNTGYHIVDVKVDGVSVGAITSYTFTHVTSNHTIDATFAIDTFTITASAGPNGSISPSGAVSVNYGGNKSFTIKANPGFMIFRILVDGSQITISNPFTITYTFSNVTSNHIIQAEFMKIPDITPPTITYISGIDINVPSEVKTNKDTYTFTVEAFDESGIGRMVVKVNGIVQIDKNNLDPTIYLSEGVNTVEVTVYDTCGNYTIKSFKVIKDSRPPVVNLTIPEKVISSTIEVKGIIYDELSGVKSVLINGTPYNLPLSGNVSLTLNLTGGVNIITVEATDNFENTTKKTYNVTYTPVSATSIIIVLQIDNPEITINGISKKIDAQGSKPIIKNGRTLLPIRVIIESLGGTVEWNAKEQKVTITLNGHSIILWIVKTTALVDGSKTTLDVASQIINGRTYLPLRFIAENLNALVQWDQSTKTVTIYYWQ